jgi:hypothetical protein
LNPPGCVPVDHGRDDVAVLGMRLLTHHDYVTVCDGRVNHGVTADSEAEQCPIADEFLGQVPGVPDGQSPGVPDDPLGQVLRPGGNLAVEGDRNRGRVLEREVHRVRQVLRLQADGGLPGQA